MQHVVLRHDMAVLVVPTGSRQTVFEEIAKTAVVKVIAVAVLGNDAFPGITDKAEFE